MNESTSVRGSTPASAYARDAASNMSSFQLYSGVPGRNAVIPPPMIPTRTSSLPRVAAHAGKTGTAQRTVACAGLKLPPAVGWPVRGAPAPLQLRLGDARVRAPPD